MNAKHTPGLTDAELDALRLVMALRPWGNSKLSHKVAAHLDGDAHALDGCPTMREKIDGACATIRRGTT